MTDRPATNGTSVPAGLGRNGALAPPSGWLALLSLPERAAYDAYLASEAHLLERIHEAAARLRAYWRARGQACENGGGPADPLLTAQRNASQAELESLYAQLRRVRCLKYAIEQEALARLGSRRN